MQMQMPVPFALFYVYPQESLDNSFFCCPEPLETLCYLPMTPEQQCESDPQREKSEEFLSLFEKELRKVSIKYLKKIWSAEDDEMLLSLKK